MKSNIIINQNGFAVKTQTAIDQYSVDGEGFYYMTKNKIYLEGQINRIGTNYSPTLKNLSSRYKAIIKQIDSIKRMKGTVDGLVLPFNADLLQDN